MQMQFKANNTWLLCAHNPLAIDLLYARDFMEFNFFNNKLLFSFNWTWSPWPHCLAKLHFDSVTASCSLRPVITA